MSGHLLSTLHTLTCLILTTMLRSNLLLLRRKEINSSFQSHTDSLVGEPEVESMWSGSTVWASNHHTSQLY